MVSTQHHKLLRLCTSLGTHYCVMKYCSYAVTRHHLVLQSQIYMHFAVSHLKRLRVLAAAAFLASVVECPCSAATSEAVATASSRRWPAVGHAVNDARRCTAHVAPLRRSNAVDGVHYCSISPGHLHNVFACHDIFQQLERSSLVIHRLPFLQRQRPRFLDELLRNRRGWHNQGEFGISLYQTGLPSLRDQL